MSLGLGSIGAGGRALFTTLCQNADCRARLGGMHIPCSGGVVVFYCQACGTVSEFRNGHFGIRPSIAGKLSPQQMKALGGKHA